MAASATTARQAVMVEYAAMGNETHCPLGLYVTPSPSDVFKWNCIIFIHRGYFAGSILHFSLSIPSSYPSTTPSVHFQTDVFHPLVDPSSGKFALGSRFPKWRPHQDYLFHVLHFVKAAFKREGLDVLREAACLNKEAYRLYRDQTALFAKLAAQSAALSHHDSALFSATPSGMRGSRPAIRFRKLGEGEEEELRDKVEEGARARLVARTEGQ